MQQSREYTVGIFGGFYAPDFRGWKHTGPLLIRASSLEQAIEQSKEQVKQELCQQFNIKENQIETIVNYVRDSNNKILCQTVWDETGPYPLSFLINIKKL